MKRFWDILFAIIFLIILLPFYCIAAFLVIFSSKGPILFKQERVGRNGRTFRILKFRTMRINTESTGQLTVGARDPRVTRVGYFLRKFKIDEWPQLWNILSGQMSFVGPRPEVPRYVALYDQNQKRVLDVRPGLTDLASVMYFAENQMLAQAEDPEKEYINKIMPAKLELNLKHMDSKSFGKDLKIVGMTISRLIRQPEA